MLRKTTMFHSFQYLYIFTSLTVSYISKIQYKSDVRELSQLAGKLLLKINANIKPVMVTHEKISAYVVFLKNENKIPDSHSDGKSFLGIHIDQ